MSNTITAFFKGRAGVAESVYQYDYGKILIIDGLNLPATFEVHFTTVSEDAAITQIGQNNRVAIPDSCISVPGIVTAYIYLHTGENDGETEYVIRFNVNRRARPDYDEDEKSNWESAASQALAMLQNSKKVNTPLDEYNQVDNGTAGQLLRTKGNGATEWVDEGLPTDEQTAQAVSNWLDEHPEATTTVQDGSITEIKLGSNVKNAVLQAENPLGSKYESDSDGNNITFATFNVLSANYWRWPVNPPCDTDEGLVKACRNIRIANPDVIGMNEVPDNPKYTPLEKLQMCGYPYAFYYGTPVSIMQNVTFGNPIMVKDAYSIISTAGVTYENYSTQPRCYSNVKIQTPNGKQISVYETHLDLYEEQMRLQVEELKTAVDEDDTDYKVVMGDFNMVYGSQIYNETIGEWLDSANKTLGTLIANNAIIDLILHTSNMEVIDYGTVENSDASDHRLLWAKFRLI